MAQAITESTRFALQSRAREVLGEQEGDTLMAHLPPVGWADVATKQDLEGLRVATQKDIEVVSVQIGALREATKADLERGLRRQTIWMGASLGVVFTLTTSLWVGLVMWLGQRLPTS
jgi:hypothetical protein